MSAGTLEGTAATSIKGDVNVTAGVLKLSNASAMDTAATLTLPGATPNDNVNLNFSGTQNIGALYFGSASKAQGTWGATTSTAQHKNAAFTASNNGLLNVTSGGATPTISTPTINPSPVCVRVDGQRVGHHKRRVLALGQCPVL